MLISVIIDRERKKKREHALEEMHGSREEAYQAQLMGFDPGTQTCLVVEVDGSILDYSRLLDLVSVSYSPLDKVNMHGRHLCNR